MNDYKSYLRWFNSLTPQEQRAHEKYCKDNMTAEEYAANPTPTLKPMQSQPDDKLSRFSISIAARNDYKLASFWNEIVDQHEKLSTPIGSMLAKSTWLLTSQQTANHKLMQEFIEETSKRIRNAD